MSLTSCIKKAGKALHGDDKAAILAQAVSLRQSGLNSKEAALKAIDFQKDALAKMLAAPTPAPVVKNEVQDPVLQRAEGAKAEAQRKAKATRLRGYTYAKSPFLAFLGKYGVSMGQKRDLSPDKNPLLSGYGPMFRNTGKNTDVLLQNAIEEYFLPQDADSDALDALITKQLNGMGTGATQKIEAVYSPEIADRVMTERMDAAQDIYQQEPAAQQEAAQNDDDPFAPLTELEYTQDDADTAGYSDAVQALQLEVNALLLTAAKLGIDTEEIYYQAHDETRNGTQQDYLEASRTALQAAIEGSPGNSSEDAGQPGNAASEEGLSPPRLQEDDALQASNFHEQASTLFNEPAGSWVLTRQPGDVYHVQFSLGGKYSSGDTASTPRAAYDNALKSWTERYAQPANTFKQLDKSMFVSGAQENLLTTPTQQDVLDQQDRKDNAEALDQKEQIDREASAQTADKPAAKIEDTGTAMFSRSPWRSALSDGIEKIPANAQLGIGWREQIQGLVNKGLVKADEVEWSGINDWLALQSGKVAKQDVLAFLDGNGVKVTETVLGKKPVLDTIAKEMGFGGWSSNLTPEQEQAVIEESKKYDHLGDNTKYSQYQLPGATNYREVLLTLPDKAEAAQQIRNSKFLTLKEEVSTRLKKDIRNLYDARDQKLLTEAEARRLLAIDEDAAIPRGEAYQSSHWDQKNVLAHIRLNDRVDAEGRKVLFVEEIQSDFAKQARKDGIKGNAESQQKFEALKAEFDGATPQRQGEISDEMNAISDANRDGVPNAPFIGKTDAWVSLALKRVIKLAADEGYAKVAFVNGEQSADRYGLSKSVSKITYKNGYLTAYDLQGSQAMHKPDVAPEALPDLIGKEAAEKLMAQEPKDGLRRLSGLAIKVGGEGMKAFYDKIVPTVAKEVVRKLGGGPLENVSIATDKNGWHILAEKQTRSDQTAFTITPAMKEKAAGGLPLFERRNSPSRATEQNVAMVNVWVNGLKKNWQNAPPIKVFNNLSDPGIPEAVRQADETQRSNGATGTPEGFYHDGTVYLMASTLATPEDIGRVLAHEALGHYGLRGLFGPALVPILKHIAAVRPLEIAAKLKDYGLKGLTNGDRLTAAEEILAEMAQKEPRLGFVKRAVAAIRTWLRQNGFKNLLLTDDEVIRSYIIPARDFVQGSQQGMADKAVAFNRGGAPDSSGAFLESPGGIQILDWFKRFGSAPSTAHQGGRDAASLLNVPFLGNVIADTALPNTTLAALNTATGDIHFHPNTQLTRAQWAQVMAEEIMHAVDLVGIKQVLSGTSARLLQGGDIANEAYSVYASKRGLADYFAYPLSPVLALSNQRQAAELFARMAVLYHGDPARMRGELPTSYEAYHVLFGTTLLSSESRILKDVQSGSPRRFGVGSKQRASAESAQRTASGDRNQPADSGLDAFRDRAARIFQADRSGSLIGDDAFDARNSDIRFSLGTSLNTAANSILDVKLPAHYVVGDLFNQGKGRLNWWHNTVGTQFNLAERNPTTFKPVYDEIQGFINDISLFATEAADKAPNILPKLDTWKDIGKSPVSARDNKAIAAPIFEGTLIWGRDDNGQPVKMAVLQARADKMDAHEKAQDMLKHGKLSPFVLKMWQGLPIEQLEKLVNARYQSQMLQEGTVFSPDELRSLFKLTPAQIGLYQEFRKATDKSLSDVGITDMLRASGEDGRPLKDALVGMPLDEASKTLSDYLLSLAETSERADHLKDLAALVQDKAERIKDLVKRGYAPLSRFGSYSLDVLGKDGERKYFGLFENTAERAKMARKMQTLYPGAKITHGTVSQENYKLFAGVSPETVELFGAMLGLESQGSSAKDKAFQDFLKISRSSRSSMKRLIERKGTAGFSEDPGRVLAGFIYSNSRHASSAMHMGEIDDHITNIPKEQGQLIDAAMKLRDYVKNPREEATQFKGFLFTQYLGGSIASAMVNLTQPFTMTFPWLSQYGGVTKAGRQMAAATVDALKAKTGDKALDLALKHAEELGIVAPQEVHQLQAQASGAATLRSGDGTTLGNASAMGMNSMKRLMFAWGKVFSSAEQFNRRTTFIAAYRTAVEQSIKDPAAFAAHAVDETQGVYNKGCVDAETECLTVSGWKRHGDLVTGEVVYAVNSDGALVESQLLDVHRYTQGGFQATEFRNSNGFSMVLTPEHKCLIQNYNSRDLKFQKPKLVRADAVKVGHHFVRTPLGDATNRKPVYSDDEVCLFAWVASEGHLFAHRGVTAKRGVGIVQSQKHNPHYVAEIDTLLQRLGGHHNRKTSRGGEMACWQLRKPLWEKIHKALPEKIVTHALVESLTPLQMALFLETFAKGDGHFPEDGGCTITQKDTVNLGALQAMAVLSGQSSTLYERMGRHDFGALYVAKTSKRAHRAALTTTPVTLDMVWCPQTEHGTWIARRNGRTFITGNSKPVWARGAIGGVLFTFKQFTISYIELAHRMATQGGPEGKKAALLMMGVLMLMGGAGGLPFETNVEDLIDAAMQRLGYNWNTKQRMQEGLADLFGKDAAQFIYSGVSGLPGVPIDVAGRFGIGKPIPGTGLLTKKQDHTQDMLELAGPAGDVAKRAFQAAGLAAEGKIGKAALLTLPQAAQNWAKAYDMAMTDSYRDAKGKKVVDADLADAGAKFMGFQPHDVSQVQQAGRQVQILKEQHTIRMEEISDQWAKGMFDKDPDEVAAAKEALKTWNENNPQAPMRIKISNVLKRVKEMRTPKLERLTKSAPTSIRGEARRQIRESMDTKDAP